MDQIASETIRPVKETENEMVEKFKEILHSNGIMEPVSSVIIKDTTDLEGEEFASSTCLVTVNFENTQVKLLNFFVKKYMANDPCTVLLDEMKAFAKESTFLVDYVTAANKMCAAKGREGLIDFYPKCYFGDDKMIVLENVMLEKGYKTLSMDTLQDVEAARIAIETLAKHHAIAHVMIQENGGPKTFFEKFPNLDFEYIEEPNFSSMMKPYLDCSIHTCALILENSGIQGSTSKAEELKQFSGKLWGILVNSLKIDDDDKLLVLCHGYWNKNMMFLTDKQTNQILHHIMIDFQTTCYNTPAKDLGYFLYTSVQPKVRQQQLHALLELYKETFNEITQDFGHPVNLTFEQVLMDHRRKLGFSYWMGLGMAIGPVMAICKEVDIREIEPSLWGQVLSNRIKKWSDDNPEESKQIAEELMEWMQEYDKLVLQVS